MKHDLSKFVRYEKREVSPNKTIITYMEGLQYKKNYIHMFISFNRFMDDETKIPTGYRKKGVNKNWVKEFKCDREKTILSKENEMYKGIKKLHAGHKRYFIFGDGGEPFVVYVSKKNRVGIYKKSDAFYVNEKNWSCKSINNLWIYTELVDFYNCLKVFVGNSVLLQLTKNKYIYIGAEIYEFASPNNDEIIKYYSPCYSIATRGNNIVPYPVAIGKHCIYFMLDKTYVYISSIKIFDMLTEKDKTRLYSYYVDDNGKNKKLSNLAKKMKDVKMIHMKNIISP